MRRSPHYHCFITLISILGIISVDLMVGIGRSDLDVASSIEVSVNIKVGV